MMQLDYTFERQIELEREEGRIAGHEEGRIAGREEGRIAGREEGRIAGREEGRRESILNLIKKKLAMGKTLEQIADELEETPEALRALYDQAKSEPTSGTTE